MGMPISTTDLHNQSISSNMKKEAGAPDKKSLRDDFLKIFLSQMTSQNPLKPYDSGEMMQQMGQLTSLEATEDMQKAVKTLNLNVAKGQLLTSAQLVGRTVQTPSEMSPLPPEKGNLMGSVIVPIGAENLVINIKNAMGQTVKSFSPGTVGSGTYDFEWDGMIEGKRGIEEFYHISAEATLDGKNTSLITNGAYKVSSVAMNPGDGTTIINLEGKGGIDLGNIIKII